MDSCDVYKLLDDNTKEIVEDSIKEGSLWTAMYIDIHAPDTDSLNNILVGIIEKIKKEEGVDLCIGVIEPPQKEADVFSTSAEIRILIDSFINLLRISIYYSPVYVEILKPNKVILKPGEAESAIMNAVSTVQDLAQILMKSRIENKEEKEKYQRKIEKRKEIGKKIMESLKK